jgi:hypothetical protein
MARVAALVPGLLFGSKVKALLEAGGHEVRLVATPEAVGGSDVAVVDLASGTLDPEAVIAAVQDVPTLAFYSHVEADVRRRAEEAGFDLVVPRSRMVREGAELVTRLAGTQKAP